MKFTLESQSDFGNSGGTKFVSKEIPTAALVTGDDSDKGGMNCQPENKSLPCSNENK